MKNNAFRFLVLALLTLSGLPARAEEGYWQYRTTTYNKALNTPGPRADIRGQFMGNRGATINDSGEWPDGKAYHRKLVASYSFGAPPILLPGAKVAVVVRTDASQENWPYAFGAVSVWKDDTLKIIEHSRTKPSGPESSQGTLEIEPGDVDGYKEMRIYFNTSLSGEMGMTHFYDWKAGTPPPPSSGTLSGTWRGTWRNSLGESGADSLDLREDSAGNLSGTWSGNVPVSGRRTGQDRIELQGRTATREFQIQGVLKGGTLNLTYVASRLNASGSYQGKSTFTRSP